jgi:glyoxylase-like metal-dependent hydrolase (beta-lactamase superfamily II)
MSRGKGSPVRTPTGQTAIIDTGFSWAQRPRSDHGRDCRAGVKSRSTILISTHYHVDHIGNLVELASRIPIGTFVDHGATS